MMRKHFNRFFYAYLYSRKYGWINFIFCFVQNY